MNKENIKKYALILAAGVGSRMNTKLPKCAVKFCGKSMIERIVDECKKCDFEEIIVIVGYKKEYIMRLLKDEVKYVYQEKQLGTAHAILCAKDYFDDKEGLCVIIPGDMPLIDYNIINNIINNHIISLSELSILSSEMENPYSYGRIVYKDFKVIKIVEEVDANEIEKRIKLINTGVYCVNIKILFNALPKIKNDNKKGEYYLTDIVQEVSKENNVNVIIEKDSYKVLGVNDLNSLTKLEIIFKEKKK